MKIVKNKNGFTLIELLAVIVILAVILLMASKNVFSFLEKGKRDVLATEGNELIESAMAAYQLHMITGNACFSVEYLYNEGLYTKGKKDDYTGSVLVSNPNNGKNPTYTFWISNGKYTISGEKGANGDSAVEGTTASENCNGESSVNSGNMFNSSSS